MKKQNKIFKLTIAAMFIALAYVMPFLTGNDRALGNMLCLMHIPVILCGFVCGGPWGFAVGFIVPLLRSFTLGAPQMVPTAIAMAFELAAYGFTSGILYRVFSKKNDYIYFTLIISMVVGRLVWGTVQFALMGLGATEFSFAAFWTGAVVTALPGIILQIVIIPVVVMLLEKVKIINKKL